MKQTITKFIFAFICTLQLNSLLAKASKDGMWTFLSEKELAGEKVRRSSFPKEYFLVKLDLDNLKNQLTNAPILNGSMHQSSLIIEFPNSDGEFEKFAVYESSIMHPELEAKFPMIKTYAAQGIDDPTATMRFSVTQFGLHTLSISGKKSTVYIDPYTQDLKTCIVYNKIALGADPQGFNCLTDEGVNLPSAEKVNGNGDVTVQNINDQKLRTFRLAQSCTAEYGNIFAGTSNQKANIQAQMAITMNRVNGVYQRDLAIIMQFIPNNDLLIYYGSTSADPWSNEWNTKTAQTIDAAIGTANYDIGHNFNTTGGGNAGCLSCVCLTTSQTGSHKGRGYTGRSNPTGDAFDIDYVAHEMGHQFGGYHVMNTCSRSGNGTTEVEPASGSSIMGYAGICSSNVQNNSHDDFNYVNIRDISTNIKTGNSTCGAFTPLTNTPPTANAGLDYIIPKSTAYILEGIASDVDGMGSLTYNWSQNDVTQSPGNGSPLSTYSVGPMYRAISPTTSPNRYMPALATILSNTISSKWEVTPSVSRVLNFSFIVRDNHVGGGQTASDLMKVTVDAAAGPFSVTSQNSATTWTAATTQTITWNVANTNTGTVNTPSVNIFFSTDGGYNYPITLASNIPNNGSAVITVPSVTTTTGRFMIRGAGNIFYDLNNAALTIVAGPASTPVSNFSTASGTLCTSSNIQLTDQSLNAPTSWTWTATSSTGVTFSNANAQNPTVSFANAGTYTVSLIAKNTAGSNTSNQTLIINPSPTVSVNSSTICAGNSAQLSATGADNYNWNTGSASASISVSPSNNTTYTVTGTTNGCSNTVTSNVTVNQLPTVSMTPPPSLVCVNDGTINLSGTPTGGSFNGTGVTGNMFDPSASGAGTFTITYNYSDSNSCSNSDTKTINVDLCTTLAELNSDVISIYPNPTSGSFTIDFKSTHIENISIEIYDAIGKLILQETSTSAKTTVYLDNYAKGIYSTKLKTNNVYKVFRIIKE